MNLGFVTKFFRKLVGREKHDRALDEYNRLEYRNEHLLNKATKRSDSTLSRRDEVKDRQLYLSLYYWGNHWYEEKALNDLHRERFRR